jgi:hypothetical protein
MVVFSSTYHIQAPGSIARLWPFNRYSSVLVPEGRFNHSPALKRRASFRPSLWDEDLSIYTCHILMQGNFGPFPLDFNVSL